MEKFLFTLVIICAVVTLLGCGKKKNTESTAQAPPSTIFYTQNTLPSIPENSQQMSETSPYPETSAESTGELPSETVTDAVHNTAPAETVPSSEVTAGKTGDMAFSDDPSNRYISSVASKYGVDPSTLAVLYTVPQNDSNIVLEFDGTKNSNGTLIRNSDTLIAIYSIDASLNSKCASKNKAKNEYPYGEMMVMFISVNQYILPEFQNELNG